MANYEQEFKEYAGKLRAQVKGIDKILKLNMNGLLDASIEQKLHAVKEEANKLLKKQRLLERIKECVDIFCLDWKSSIKKKGSE